MGIIVRPGVCIQVFLILVMTGCGGGGGSEDPGAITISGVASKGPIDGGAVKVFSLHTDGTVGEQLGASATTGADGAFSVALGEYSGNVILEVAGGSYTDEATNTTVINTATLRAAVTNVHNRTTASITALTEVAVEVAELKGGLTTNAVNNANARVSQLTGFNILTTLPADVLAVGADMQTDSAQAYGVALAGISQMLADGMTSGSSNPSSPVPIGADGTASGSSSAPGSVPDGIEGVIVSIANDLADNDQLDSVGFAYAAAIATFLQGENNKTNVEASRGLFESITGASGGGDVVGSTGPSVKDLFDGNWFTIEHDDGMRPDGVADDPASEHNTLTTITVNDDGSWNWSTPTSSSLISASAITFSQGRLSVTITDDGGQGRTVLTYDYDNHTINGQWQKLAADNVTFYENYETWLMVPPLICHTVGGPNSYGGFLSAVADCGTQQPFVAEEMIGKTIYFADAPGTEFTFTDLGYGLVIHDGDVANGDIFYWYPAPEGLLELAYDRVAGAAYRKHIAWLGTDNITGSLQVSVYSEGDNAWSGDMVFDGKADGEISETSLVVVADIGAKGPQVAGTWTSRCATTLGDPRGAYMVRRITFDYKGGFESSTDYFNDFPCATLISSSTSSGSFVVGGDISLTNGGTGPALDTHITMEDGNAVDKMSYSQILLDSYYVVEISGEYTTASERDADINPFYWWYDRQ